MKIEAMGSASMQPASNNPSQVVDTESKEIQTQIANAQNKLQQISSNQNMSDEEKSRLRQEIQKQISDLNNRLRKHQLEVRQQQQQQAQNMQKTSSDTKQTETSEQTEESRRSTDTRQNDDAKRAQDTRRTQDDRRVKDTRKARETRQTQDTRRAQDTRKTQDSRRAQEARQAQDTRRAQEVRKTQDARRAQEARQTQNARKTEDISPVQDVRQTSDTRQTDTSANKPDTDERRTADIPASEMKAVVSADTAVKHAAAQGQVSSSISSKARVLEGEIRQDSRSDRNIKSKKTELETLEQKAATASSAQLSILSDASGEVRRVNVKDNVNSISSNNNQTKVAQKSAQVATGSAPDNTINKGKVGAYSKGRMFSSVNFSF